MPSCGVESTKEMFTDSCHDRDRKRVGELISYSLRKLTKETCEEFENKRAYILDQFS